MVEFKLIPEEKFIVALEVLFVNVTVMPLKVISPDVFPDPITTMSALWVLYCWQIKTLTLCETVTEAVPLTMLLELDAETFGTVTFPIVTNALAPDDDTISSNFFLSAALIKPFFD